MAAAPLHIVQAMTIPVRRLRVHEKTVDFAVLVHKLTRSLPHAWQHLANQARRSSCSIALNLSEGCAQHGAEQRRYFRISRGSAWECDTTFLILARDGAIAPAAAREIEESANVISAMITSLIKRSERVDSERTARKRQRRTPNSEPRTPDAVAVRALPSE
jgi:four helix bundle protein